MKLVPLLLVSLAAAACARPQLLPPQTEVTSRGPEPRPVYRLDFVLAARDAAGVSKNTAFTLNLEEHDQGEVLVGRNVPLVVTTNMIAPRQDVGIKVKAHYFALGDRLLLDVSTEMSAFEAPSDIRKVVVRGDALAEPGKSTLVASLDEDGKHYQLSVTPTKLH